MPTRQAWYHVHSTKPFLPAFKVFAHVQMVYLGRVDKAQEQHLPAFTQAPLYMVYQLSNEDTPCVCVWGGEGAGGCMGENSPPLTNFRIVYQYSGSPYWVFICVTGRFLISSVKALSQGRYT